jgi:hypothetical protein
MNPVIEIRPAADGGYTFNHGNLALWYAEEIHAINYAQDLCSDCDVVVFFANGKIKHRYSAMPARD